MLFRRCQPIQAWPWLLNRKTLQLTRQNAWPFEMFHDSPHTDCYEYCCVTGDLEVDYSRQAAGYYSRISKQQRRGMHDLHARSSALAIACAASCFLACVAGREPTTRHFSQEPNLLREKQTGGTFLPDISLHHTNKRGVFLRCRHAASAQTRSATAEVAR